MVGDSAPASRFVRTMAQILRECVEQWFDHGASRLAAALAYYTAFSIAPLVFLVAAVAGSFYRGSDVAIIHEATRLIPGVGGDAIITLLDAMHRTRHQGTASVVVGVITLIIGAGGMFGQLQDALNTVWGVHAPRNRPILLLLKRRFISFTMLLGTAFLMLVSLILNTMVAATLESMHRLLAVQAFFWTALNAIGSVATDAVVFSLIFAIVPDTKLGWRDVWVGGTVTAVLFMLGQQVLGFYLGDASRLSVYGAFASLIVFLLWVYYSAQILLLGAEFTNVYSRRHRSRRAAAKSI